MPKMEENINKISGIQNFQFWMVPVSSRVNTAYNLSKRAWELGNKHVETLGYERFWISEHHIWETFVSSATPIFNRNIILPKVPIPLE